MATQALNFTRAVKYDAKARVCLVGPSGSGKSLTSLGLARLLAGPTGKIAAIDTEHGSLSKYADLFDFDVIELDSYSPYLFIDSLTAAEQAGYAVFLVDSMSHFWMGKDGALEYVDNARKRSTSRDDMAGWKDFRPQEREMVDRMIASRCHVIVTMRTKTAYELQKDPQTGKTKRVKIGLAPVQREGLEYEFDLVGEMSQENELIVDKTRCSAIASKVYSKPKPADFQVFADWLKGEKRSDIPVPPAQKPIDIGTHPMNTQAAANYVRDQKLAEIQRTQEPPAKPEVADVPPEVAEMFKVMVTQKLAGFAKVFQGFNDRFTELLGAELGTQNYLHTLGLHGVDSYQKFRSLATAKKCVLALYAKVQALTDQANAALPDVTDEDVPFSEPFPEEAA